MSEFFYFAMIGIYVRLLL